jgi:preprotein translocase subunit SecA
MLGGNPEYVAKREMRRMEIDEELIAVATGTSEIDDEEVINARNIFRELYEKYKEEIAPEAEMVREAGGLFILGTERHESRRIDNQLRGRAGRQGDVGTSRFYIAMEDDIMRLFGSERYMGFAEKMGLPEDQPLETKMLSGAIENAQKKIEDRNFTSRKNVLQYDDVMNKQRELIYDQRRQVIDGMDIQKNITSMIEAMVLDLVTQYTASGEYPDDWNLNGLIEECEKIFLKEGEVVYTRADLDDLEKIDIIETLTEKALECKT